MSSLHAVLALVVPAQIHFTLKALGTNVTSKRFEACVFPAVGDQVGALAERFTTHLALVGLFTYKIEHTHINKQKQKVRNLYNHIFFLFFFKSFAWRSFLSTPSGESGFVICTINGAKCFYWKDNVCINIYGWRIVLLFRFVKHLLATKVNSIEFL